jgi:hypothetical protein
MASKNKVLHEYIWNKEIRELIDRLETGPP